jgi:hypothetical protein
MTNEEAIKEIEKLYDWISKQPSLLEDWCKTSDALYIATQALKAQPNSNEFFNFDAPMVKNSEVVSRGAVDKLSRDLVHVTRDKADFLCNFWEGLNALPSVYPERPKGKWIKCKSRFGTEYFECSECGRKLNWIDRDDNYCNSCGSDNSESTKEWLKERDTKLAEMSGGKEDEASN